MKSYFFILPLIISIFLISCSNVADVKVVTEKQPTLKSVVADKELNVTWSKEIEGDRLIENIYSDSQYVSDFFYLSPLNVTVSHKNDDPVFPELIGFGSLDISNMPSNVNYIINNFCESISNNFFSGPEQYFDSNYYFNFVFFKSDLIKNWKNRFGVEFPLKTNEELHEKSKANEEAKANEEEADNIIGKKQSPLFTNWIIGKPFSTEEIIQVPVRFCCKQGFVDVTLYINLENNKIFQIVEGPYAGKK